MIVHFEGGPSAREHDHFHVVLDRGYDEMAHFYQVEIELPSCVHGITDVCAYLAGK